MKTQLCLFVLLLTATVLASAQGVKKPRTLEDYQPRTLGELSKLMPENFRTAIDESAARGENTRALVHTELYPSRVKVVYGGMSRPLGKDKKAVVESWANRWAGMPEFYTVPYQTEALFSEGDKSYWLAVRKEFPAQELKTGDALDLCVIKLGNTRAGDALEPVILVEKIVVP